ncbi:MAG: hypothetical protein COA67_03660 [Lutibacter sp.]|nr:MAG: hypothetical protein COA67_03660 [Lutibacter sp.]
MRTLIMLTNNDYDDPFLHSQLINVYKNNGFFDEMYLFCGQTKPIIEPEINLVDNFVQSKNKKKGFIKYYFAIIRILRSKNKETKIFHLRGFVSAFLFYFIPRGLKKGNYVYDPRGSFIYSLEETRFKKKSFLIRFLRRIENNLIKNSFFTILESKGLINQMAKIYGHPEKYVLCYNATTFTDNSSLEQIKNKESINICYCGSVNHWHDIDELYRLFEYVNKLFNNKEVNNFLFTQKRNHEVVKERFQNFKNNLDIDFIPYNELEKKLQKMDICLSVVVPKKSTKITSPIKIADYVMLNKIVIANKGIGDFDDYFKKNNSAILYDYQKKFNFVLHDIETVNVGKNEQIKKYFKLSTNKEIILSKIKNSF